MTKSITYANAVLDAEFGSGSPASHELAFCTDTIVASDTGSTITEPSGNNYSRTSVTNNSTNWPSASGGSKSNGAALSSPQSTGSWGRIIDWALVRVSTGVIAAFGHLVGTRYPFTATAADTLTAPGHGFSDDDRVRVFGSALPTGLTHGGSYYVINVSGDTFQLSATSGGAAVNLTTAGSGDVAEDLGRDVTATGEKLTFGVGNLTLTES